MDFETRERVERNPVSKKTTREEIQTVLVTALCMLCVANKDKSRRDDDMILFAGG